MFNTLYLEAGMMVNLRNIRLEKAKLVKIRPHLTEFIMNPNPRTILENSLRHYLCVTKGDTITVMFNKKKYLIDIVECKPKDAVSLTNVDCEVDFDTPLDYKEEAEVSFDFNLRLK
jgi:ubiquitin fusion degradation protein 1